MPVQSGRVIVDPTQGAFNRDSRKEIEQIKREIVKPKEKPVPPAGGTGTAIARSGDFRADGTYRYSFFDYTFYDDEGDPLGLTLGGSGLWFQIPTAGIYLMSARVGLSFTSAPAPGETLLRFNLNSIQAYNNMTRQVVVPSSGDYVETHTLGPLIVPAGNEFYGRFGLAVENSGSGLPALTLADCGVDFYVARVS